MNANLRSGAHLSLPVKVNNHRQYRLTLPVKANSYHQDRLMLPVTTHIHLGLRLARQMSANSFCQHRGALAQICKGVDVADAG
jgi:hypothetical protein